MTTETPTPKPTTGFRQYDHLQRQGHRNTRGVEEGRVYVFPKIDGTNASVWSDGTTVFAGSRKRQLSEDADNAGFYAWLLSDDPKAMSLRGLALAYPELIFYGEWLVPHTLKTYTEDAWRRFYVFDVFKRAEIYRGYLDFTTYAFLLADTGVDIIKPIGILDNPTGAKIKEYLEGESFLIQDGAGVGEGIVVKNYGWRDAAPYGFDRVWGKFVRTEFKAEAKRPIRAGLIDDGEIEIAIAQQFVTATLVRKTLAKVLIEVTNSEPVAKLMGREELIANYRGRIIPQLIGRVWNDLIEEEMWNILKKFKRATIDFAKLQSEATRVTKTLATDLF